MKRITSILVVACLLCTAGCNVAEILGAKDGYLFSSYDTIVPPGKEAQVRVRLQSGDFLKDERGYVVHFMRDGKLYKVAQTDRDGAASIAFTPDKPGDYVFTAQLQPKGFKHEPPAGVEVLVSCRQKDAPILIVDLDKTLVAGGFGQVLTGSPPPMELSVEVMDRLSKDYVIVYLTQRPDAMGPKSKAWLKEHKYPRAPLLLAETGKLLAGNEKYKSKAIKNVAQEFGNIQIGIGDKRTDAIAYRQNGLKTYLISYVGPATPPDDIREMIEDLQKLSPEVAGQVQAVLNWRQVADGIYDNKRFTVEDAVKGLRMRLNERSTSVADRQGS